ncbi:hypothetical protein OR1_02829 [Geobacter sp. OR-1]|nr:hypothetical protein OR1_02829 [Geobacter sp. OR-1]
MSEADTEEKQRTPLDPALVAERVTRPLSLISAALLFAVIAAVITALYTPPPFDQRGITAIFCADPADFAPEPLERLLFFSGVVIVPVLLLAGQIVFSRLVKLLPVKIMAVVCRWTVPVVLAMVSALALFVVSSNPYFLEKSVFNGTGAMLATVVAAILLWVILLSGDEKGIVSHLRVPIRRISLAVAASAIILVCLYSIIGLESIENLPIFYYSFNAVFHAVVQVCAGKELLVDLVHQYGLYPHFIEPVFAVIGLSVLKFSLLMSLLMGVALVCLLRFILESSSSRIIGYLGFVCLVYYSFFFSRVVHQPDNFFQYHPIRFFWPAVAVYFVFRYLQTGTKRLYLTAHLLFALSVLWNFETGVVVFLSWLLVLIYQEAVERNFRRMGYHFLTSAVSLSLVTGVFVSYMRMRYGSFPEFGGFFQYQQLFYLYGYYMMPMPLWHPWMLVILVYAHGLLASVRPVADRRYSGRSAMIFFLSIMGVGLFAYYQGRSHDLNLLAVSFPAILILILHADKLANRACSAPLPGDRYLFLLITFCFVFGSATYLMNIPAITGTIISRIRPVLARDNTVVTRNVDFIRRNSFRGEKLLILSMHSGIYYLESGTVPPLKIPGITELLLARDFNKIVEYLGSAAEKVIVDRQFISLHPELAELLEERFRIRELSPAGDIGIMEKVQ